MVPTENDSSTNILLLHVFTAVTFLMSRFPATVRGIHIQVNGVMGGIYEALGQMGSGAITYILGFTETGSGNQKLIEGIHRHRQHNDHVCLA
jgi:hypothetical protein